MVVNCASLLALAGLPTLALGQVCQPYWNAVGGSGGYAYTVVGFDDGTGPALYAGGRPPGSPVGVDSVSRWNGHHWQVLDDGLPGPGFQRDVTKLWVLDDGLGPRLYVMGQIPGPGAYVPFARIWKGSSWTAAPEGLVSGWANIITSPQLTFDDGNGPRIYGNMVMGSQSSSPRMPGRWLGAGWEPLGGPPYLSSTIAWRLFGFDSGSGRRLHIIGGFSSIAGVPAQQFARWSGSAWEPIGSGVLTPSFSTRDTAIVDHGAGPMLYVADVFLLNGQTAGRVVRWDGQAWSSLPGGGIANIGINAVHKLAVFDDGRGPALYIGGMFSEAGGIPVRNIVRFDGTNYEPLGAGLGTFIDDMTVFNDGRGESLFVAGTFSSVGGGVSPGIAQWVGCRGQCYPNCDNSSVAPVVNIADFSCFLQKFARNDPYANCNVDAGIDLADFACFMQKFASGCP